MSDPATTARNVRDPVPLWKALQTWLWLYIVVQIATIPLTGVDLYFEGGAVYALPPELSVAYGFGLMGIAVAHFATFIVCVVLTCKITVRMMRNLHELNAPVQLMSPGWAAGWYFIPFANLVMPARGVSRMWDGTDALIPGEVLERPSLALWWGTWIVSNILSNISFRLALQSGGLGDAPTDLGMYSVSLVLDIVSAALSAIAAFAMMGVFGPLARAQQRVLNTHAFA